MLAAGGPPSIRSVTSVGCDAVRYGSVRNCSPLTFLAPGNFRVSVGRTVGRVRDPAGAQITIHRGTRAGPPEP